MPCDLVTQANILLGGLPRMLRSIVEGAVASQADMRLLEHVETRALEDAVARTEPDVLIVNEHPDRPEAWFSRLLLAHPSLKIFVLTHEGRCATALEFRRTRLADTSPTTLIEAIRTVLRREDDRGC